MSGVVGTTPAGFQTPGGGGGGVPDAPSDGTIYGRLNGAWSAVVNAAGGTMTAPLYLDCQPVIANTINGRNGGNAEWALNLGDNTFDPAGNHFTVKRFNVVGFGVGVETPLNIYADNTTRMSMVIQTTGVVLLSQDPTEALEAATKQYVDAHAPAAVAAVAVTGSHADGSAFTSLLAALVTRGIIIDNTTP